MSYNYLASPYTHADPDVMEQRYCAARDALSWLLQRQIWTYSPIVHCHDLAKAHSLPVNAQFWCAFNRVMLSPASTMLILQIDGWNSSKGVKGEIDLALAGRIPINLLRPLARRGYKLITTFDASELQ